MAILKKKSFYLTTNKQHILFLKNIFKDNDNYHFYFRDKIWILTNKLVLNKNDEEIKRYNELLPKYLKFNKKNYPKYNLNDGYQGLGWVGDQGGLTSAGYLSSLMFSINQKECKDNNYLNINYYLDKNLHLNNYFYINIFVNKKFQKKLDLKFIKNDYFTINIDCKKKQYFIEFEIFNPISLRQNKKHLNAEKLGFKIKSIELIN